MIDDVDLLASSLPIVLPSARLDVAVEPKDSWRVTVPFARGDFREVGGMASAEARSRLTSGLG